MKEDEIEIIPLTQQNTPQTQKTRPHNPAPKPTAPNLKKIGNILPGTVFENRRALCDSGIHRPTMGGICGTRDRGCDSIVISGGYEDDEDLGDKITYTGAGAGDQEFIRGNGGLLTSFRTQRPVRVVRGAAGGSPWSPLSGYRYDGLYKVSKCERVKSKHSSRIIVQAVLVRCENQPPLPPPLTPEQRKNATPARKGRAAGDTPLLPPVFHSNKTDFECHSKLKNEQIFDSATGKYRLRTDLDVSSCDLSVNHGWPIWTRDFRLWTWEYLEMDDLITLLVERKFCAICWRPFRKDTYTDYMLKHLESHLELIQQRIYHFSETTPMIVNEEEEIKKQREKNK